MTLWVLLSVVLGLGVAQAAEGEPRPAAEVHRTVAMLEYRTNVSQAQDLAGRLALALSQNTSLQVLDAREGRRRLGARLDADVAACAGEVGCVAAIGQRLGAAEVLLLAVSQLGDMVLAIQRIHVGERSVVARLADSVPAGQALDEPKVLSWLQQLYPPETFKRYGQIRISTDIDGAQVYENAKARGQTPLSPLQVLAPGNYRILVEKSSYLPFQAQFSVMPDTTVEVAAQLVREQKSTPWYKRWYVWAAIGGGLAVAGGAAALGATLSREPPDMTRVPGIADLSSQRFEPVK